MARVFDDEAAVLRRIRELGPYYPVGVYNNAEQPEPEPMYPNWFLVEPDCDLIVQNPRWIAAAREAFAAEIVRPIRCVVNLNPPAPAADPHLDLPVFRGFSSPEMPIWLLMAMSRSRLFLDWLVPLASGVAWFWRGEGGEFAYWPDGPAGEPVAERPPLWNVGVMADNEAMWHRVGATGPAARQGEFAEGVPASARMDVLGEGWEIDRAGRRLAAYAADEVRISIVWKGYVFKDEAHLASFEDSAYDLDLDQVVAILHEDLAARGLATRPPADPLGDLAWRALLDRTYVSPFA
jgi:hypothetical protein